MNSKVIYPAPLTKGESIGITAPSSGVTAKAHIARLELIESQWKYLGYGIVEGKCLRNDFKHVSGPSKDRARDLTELWKNSNIQAIIPPWGGELLIEILPHLDFDSMANSPKWLVGYSDTSTLLFALTLKTGIATLHGSNFMDTIQGQIEGVHEKALEVLCANEGASIVQKSFQKFQVQFTPFENQLDALFNATEPVEWKTLNGETKVHLRGRLVGGCLDTLVHLVGTPYGDLPSFVKLHQNDGVILYLENCDFSPCHVARALWQMRFAGWFENIRGIIFGRSNARDCTSSSSLSYAEALRSVLSDLSIPILFDADIGHRPPQMFLVNGSLAHVAFDSGKATVTQSLI